MVKSHPVRAAFAGLQPFYAREAALCVPAVALLLTMGLFSGQAAAAALAAGAAFSVGFGAARDLRGWRWAAMAGAALSVALAALIGGLTAMWFAMFLSLAATGLQAACGALALVDEDIWWVALQAALALLVADYLPGAPSAAMERASAALAGGGAQLVIVFFLAQLFPGGG